MEKRKSTGVLLRAVRIRTNKTGDTDIEAFQNAWKLTNIIDWTPKQKEQ